MGREGGSSLLCLGGTTCRPASVGMLQSGGKCLVLNHECMKLFVVSHGLSLFGLQAAWRPVCIRGGVVKIVLALCWLCCVAVCVFLGSVCGFKLGRQAAWRPRCNRGGVVKTVGGTVQFAGS